MKESSTLPVLFYFFKKEIWGIPWWSDGQDLVFSLSGPQVPSLIGGTKILQAMGDLGCGQEKKKSEANTAKYYRTKLDSKSFIRIHLCFILETFKKTKKAQHYSIKNAVLLPYTLLLTIMFSYTNLQDCQVNILKPLGNAYNLYIGSDLKSI